MSINKDTFYTSPDDAKYDVTSMPKSIEKDTAATIFNVLPSSIGSVNGKYNSTQGQLTRFDVFTDGDVREALSNWSLEIDMIVGEETDASAGTWNSLTLDKVSIRSSFANLFDRIIMRINSDSSPLEEYGTGADYQIATLLRQLKEYDQDVLENSSQTNFTPFFEDDTDQFDTGTGISDESKSRRLNWGIQSVDATGANIAYVHKSIPFSDLLSCCKAPGYYKNIRKMQLDLYWNADTTIPFKSVVGAATAGQTPKVTVTNCFIIRQSQRMSVEQNVDTLRERFVEGEDERFLFDYNIISRHTYSSNTQVRHPNVRSCQAAIAGFRAVDVDNTVYINPQQYIPSTVTSAQVQYSLQTIPSTPIYTSIEKISAYRYYQIAAKKATSKVVSAAIPAIAYSNTMFWMWIPIADTTYPLMNEPGKDLVFDIKGGPTAQLTTVAQAVYAANIDSNGGVALSK
jgi:hypothetical protein